MTILTIFSHGFLLAGLIALAVSRPGARGSSRESARKVIEPERERPDRDSLAGVPRRLLQSERASPGALLREELTTRPTSRD